MSKSQCDIRTRPATSSTAPRPEQPDLDGDTIDLVRVTAWQIFSRIPRHTSLEISDILQAGHLGLLRARHSYRPECGVPFCIYARYRIRGEILDMLRRLDTIPRSLRRWQRTAEVQTRALTLRLQRLPTDQELGDTLGIQVDQVRRNRQILASGHREQEPHEVDADQFPARPRESAAAPQWMPDAIQERKESMRVLLRSIEKLNARARRVVLLYYSQNLTMKQIGILLDVNESRVSQIHKTALQSMSVILHSAGIRPATRISARLNNR